MTEIYVDADACPVKNEVLRVAERHGLRVHIVSNSYMRLPESPLIERVVVDDGPDAADDWIAARAGPRDVAITADVPLASRCVKNGAAAISPAGKPFTEENIGLAVATRNLMADLRETNEIRTYNPGFTAQDRSQFLQALENAIQKLQRQSA